MNIPGLKHTANCIGCTAIGTLLGALFCGELDTNAAPPIIKIDPSTDLALYPGFEETHGNWMVGWTFQLLVPFTVTQVGWYDKGADGLSRAWQVGLWKGEGRDGEPPRFPGPQYFSLIGDPQNGLIIPSGTNASLTGVWRVLDLPEPLTLEPGFYELGGLDTSGTSDVIQYIGGGGTIFCPYTPPGSPVLINEFLWAGCGQTNLYPTTCFYLGYGLELGPMLFATNAAPTPGSGLSIRPFPLSGWGSGILLIWPTGTLQEADKIAGPYTAVTNAASPYVLQHSGRQKFYKCGP